MRTDKEQQVIDQISIIMCKEGVKLLQEDRALAREALTCARSLVENRSADVLDSPDCDLETIMAGVALGIALQKSTELIEQAGGMDTVAAELFGEGKTPEQLARELGL